jgi:TonB-dependent SusC/RagA subfamily outer membrane receptor
VFSFIGYEKVEEPINGRSTVNVEMRQSTSEMDEVVVTGVLERNNESFTGSHVKVDNEELQRTGNDNVFQSLRNVDPNFNVLENLTQGSDPNALPDLQLRGQSTFPADESELNENLKANFLKQPNQPHFVLDGFESSAEEIFDLEMDRIESVTVLKDASAKALYGSQAANGVVVVETKKLYATEPVISYNSKLHLELPDLSSYNLTNSMEKLEAERIDGMYDPDLNDGQDAIALQQLYSARRQLALQGLDTDWMAKPLRNGIGQDHSLAVELGTDDLKVRGSVSFGDEQGVMQGSYRQNLGGNVKASYRAGDVLLRNTMRVSKNNTQDSPYGTFDQYAQMNPYWRATNQDGSIPYYAETGPGGEQFTNPLSLPVI